MNILICVSVCFCMFGEINDAKAIVVYTRWMRRIASKPVHLRPNTEHLFCIYLTHVMYFYQFQLIRLRERAFFLFGCFSVVAFKLNNSLNFIGICCIVKANRVKHVSLWYFVLTCTFSICKIYFYVGQVFYRAHHTIN